MTHEDPNPAVRRVVTGVGGHGYLTQGQFDEMRKKLPNPYCTDDTSVVSAGFKLGVQHALEYIRAHHVR